MFKIILFKNSKKIIKENQHGSLLIRLFKAKFACLVVSDMCSVALNCQAVDGYGHCSTVDYTYA